MKYNKKRKYAVFTISFLTVAAISMGVYARAESGKAERLGIAVSNNCLHEFEELVTAVEEMDTALQKSLCVTSPAMASAVCTELFGKAMTAQMSLGSLPFSSFELERTAGFISRVGDYAFALGRSASAGNGISGEQREALKALADTSSVLSGNLRALQGDMLEGILTMDELIKSENLLMDAEAVELPTVGESMRLIESEFPELPALIYDGPFSNHLSEKSPAMLEGAEEIDLNRGRDIAAGFLRMGHTRVYPAGESGGELPCLYYQAERNNGDTVFVAVTKRGGKVLSMLSSHRPWEATMELEEGRRVAADFLHSRGYRNMEESYHMLQEGVLTVNFAYTQDGVTCYSDLIKVEVAMDSGEVCGFEALGYISSHRERDIPAAEISAETAASALVEGIAFEHKGLALIPSPGGEERLCHEFLCSDERERKFIVYVNAQSGEQEKILLLLEDENGSLTL